MNLWEVFFGLEKTEPPHVTLLWRLILFAIIFGIIYSSKRYYNHRLYQLFFKLLQVLQLVLIYGWYWGNAFPLSESLPFYHCRLAMLALLFLPDKSIYKQYFALLGVFGTVVAFVYPVFDPYPFPHITILSLIVGHIALFGNSLNYLLNYYDKKVLSWQKIAWISLAFNAFLVLVDQVLQADYGFLRTPPLVGDQGWLGNFILISVVLTAGISLTSQVFKRTGVEVEIALLED